MNNDKIAMKIIKNLRQPINNYYRGYCEKNNSLFLLNINDLVDICIEKDISIIGWFILKENEQKIINGILMDIGIIIQDNYPHDHDTYWCYATKKWIDKFIEDWNKSHKTYLE